MICTTPPIIFGHIPANSWIDEIAFLAKISNEFASAMLNKPQDRLEIVQPILTALNIQVCEFLFTFLSMSSFIFSFYTYS